jgi:hypothetical protein
MAILAAFAVFSDQLSAEDPLAAAGILAFGIFAAEKTAISPADPR